MKRFAHYFLSAFGIIAFIGSTLSLSQAKTLPPAKSEGTALQTIAQAPAFQSNVEGTLTDQGLLRTYDLHTPGNDSFTHPLPLIVALHGSGMQGKDMATTTAFNRLADQAGFVVVYPDGLQQNWNVAGTSSEDNVAFVHALINHVQQIRSIDAQQIYVVGLSDGGFLAQELACKDPSQIAAIATVAASLPTQFISDCQTQQPVSLLMVNGTADSIVPWQGDADPEDLPIPSVSTLVDFWQRHDNCSSPPQAAQTSKTVEVTDYSCPAGTEVKLVALEGAGHIWAGGGYGQSAYGDTTDRVWQFFQDHTLTSSTPSTVDR